MLFATGSNFNVPMNAESTLPKIPVVYISLEPPGQGSVWHCQVNGIWVAFDVPLCRAGGNRLGRLFPNEASITRLIGAVLLEQNDEWLLQHRYMQIEGMAELTSPLIDADPAKLP